MALNNLTRIGNTGFGTNTSINTAGIVTAASFSGDGSGLTGITALGSGVVVQEEGSNVGTAQTINFVGTGVTATISGGIASVEIATSGGGGGSGLSNVVEDTTPQLGGNLDLNSKNITGTGDINITGVVTATTFVGALTGDASGNAATATTLQNARTIGGVSFDGSANINLPGVKAAGNQDTSGTASVATNVTVANEASDTECFVMFGVNATGNNAPKSSSSLKYNSSTGGLTAGSFIGDGSGLTGITASGSGVIIRDDGSLVGTAGTIDFGTNVSVSPISAGVVTVTAAAGSIPGISTAQTTQLNNLTVAGVTTFTGAIDANGDLDVDGHTNLDNVSIAGVVTATSFVRTSGTSSQFLKADGSVDSSTYLTSYTETDPVVAAINGIVKSNGSTISAATAGTDYLTPTGDGSGLTGIAVTAFTNVQATWSVGGDTSGYTFTGPGQDGAEQNPDIYLVRGQRYRFINTTGSSHPFRIQSDTSGTAYTDGVSGSQNGTQDFNVQHDAPVRLYYQCTIHSGMIGNIYVVGGSDWRMTDVATNATPEIFTNLNVGIGTDNPNQELHIHASGTSYVQFTDEASGTAVNDGAVFGLDNPHLYAWNYEAGDFVVATNAAEKLRVTSDGKVGIGTNMASGTPSNYGFAVYRASGTGYLYTETGGSSASAGLRAKAGTADFTIYTTEGTGQLAVYDNTNNVQRLKIDSSGKLKLGSNTLVTPSTDADNFVIDTGDVDSGISILSATTGRIYFGDAASNDQGSIRYVHTDDSMRFETNSSERLRITSGGQVQIPVNASGATSGRLQLGASQQLTIFQDSANAYLANDDFIISNGAVNEVLARFRNGGAVDLNHNNSTKLATTSTGISVTGNIAITSGNGIDFSATGNSSGSIGSEVFDDYEEGTWTPQITQGVSGTPTYQFQIGWYTKIGRIVTLYFYLRLNSSGNTGSNTSMRIGNFPFPVASNYQNTYNRGMGVSNYHSIPGFTSGNISFYGGGSSNTFATMYLGNQGVLTSSSLNSEYIIGGFEYISE